MLYYEQGKLVNDRSILNKQIKVTKKKKKKKDEDIAPVKKTSKKEDIAPVKEKNDTWFKAGAFSDGVDGVGDFFGDLGKTIIGTVGDVGVGLGKGITRLGEGVVDATKYGVAGIADITGNDNYANKVRKSAKKNDTDKIWNKAEKKVDKWSVLGNKADSVTEGLGQVAGIILTGGVAGALGAGAGATTAITTGAVGISGMGSGISQAYQDGATDKEAYTYGTIAGVGEAATELLFGGLGKTVKAVGLSKGLSSADDILAKKVSGMFNNQIAKNFTEYGIKSGAEGTEEVLSGIISAVGKKVTYMDEKELNDIIKDENLLEQFVVGSITSGIAQSGVVPGMKKGSLIESNKKGTDFITGLTEIEQKVVDKEYENRIKEAKEQGKKLSSKEQNKLYDEVIEDLDKGSISIDTIESALGGDTYKNYQDIASQEDALLKEYEELGNKTNATLKEQTRYKELAELIKENENNTQKETLKKQLADEVYGLAKDSRLVESYNEKTRRSEVFKADLSKYDTKQQEIVKKAVESGILNNTSRTHEFVDIVAKISADKGVSFDFTNNQKLKESGFTVEGKTVNGYVKDGNIAVNIDSSKSLNSIVGHEITHVLEGKELYTELQEAVKNYATTKGDYDTRIKELSELYKDVKDANIEGEVTADLVGDYLFTDKDFVNNLSVEKPNIFKKIFDEIKYLYKMATAGSKEARQLEKVKRTFEKAYKQSVKGNSNKNIQYSLENVPEGYLRLSDMQKTLDNYYVPNEFKHAIIKEGDIVEKSEFAIARQEIFKEVTNRRIGKKTLKYNDSVKSSNHIFYYNNYSETGFNVTEIYNIENDYSNSVSEVYDESINRRHGESVSDRVEGIGNRKGYDIMHSAYVQNGSPSTRDIGIFEKGTTNRQAGNFQEDRGNKRASEIAPVKDEVSSKDDAFFDGDKKYSLSDADIRYSLSENKKIYDYQSTRPKVRGGWTIEKIQKQLKNESSRGSAGVEFTEFDSVDEIMDNIFYHGSTTFHKNLKAGSTIKEQYRTGGYGEEYHSISLSKSKNVASNFTGMSNSGVVTPVLLRKGANVIEMSEIKDSIELEEMLPELWEQKVDAVKIGDWENSESSEQELVVLNPNAITVLDKGSHSFAVYQKPKFENLNTEEIVDLMNQHKKSLIESKKEQIKKIENREGYYKDFTDEQQQKSIKNIESSIQAIEDRYNNLLNSENIQIVAGIENIRQYKVEDSENVKRYDRRTERGKIQSDIYHDKFLQERIRSANETINSVNNKETEVSSKDDAFFDGDKNYSLSDSKNEQQAPYGNFNIYGKDVALEQAPVQDIVPVQENVSKMETTTEDVAPLQEEQANQNEETVSKEFKQVVDSVEETKNEELIQLDKKVEEVENTEEPKLTVNESYNAKLENYRNAIEGYKNARVEIETAFDESIEKKTKEYESLKGKGTKKASNILMQIENLKLRKANNLSNIDSRIEKTQSRVDNMIENEETVKQGMYGKRRKVLHTEIIDKIKTTFSKKGFDFDDVLINAKNKSTFASNDNTPQRFMEKTLGYKEGQALADITVNKVAQNESAGIKWVNENVGLLKQLSKEYSIKPRTKESAAAQMYAEGFYINPQGEYVKYGDKELIADFKDLEVVENIKKLAKDSRIRGIYDDTLNQINESRTRNAYPEIPRRENYFMHFIEMDDAFSRLGIPFNPNDIRAKDLPTDINGMTADLKPGQPYFASAIQRKGVRTTYDLLGGVEKYINSAKNQIFHIDDIQTLRATRNYIADMFGQAKGLEDLDTMTEAEASERIEQVFGSHLSNFAKFLHEEANVIAGKTALIDRGLEGIVGRKGITFLNTLNGQVGSNMVGFNASSSLTNFISVMQSMAKSSKVDTLKAFTQTVSNKIGSIFGRTDGFAENNPAIIRRKGIDTFARKPFEKISDAGYLFMGVVDDISTEIIVRTKFNELTRKGMSEEQAHIESDKWAHRILGDRSLGQQPLLYNSKMLGLITKFQLEVRNQLDSQFYDTIQEAKVSTEDINNVVAKNAIKSAKIGSTMVQLAVLQHVFGKAFESVAGYNPAFDIIEVLMTTLGFDDEEDSEDTPLDNIEQGFLALLEDMPYSSVLTGGRIPISSALPIKELVTGKDSYGMDKSRLETLKEVAPYYLLPTGYGQIKKTKQGLDMFSAEHPVSGSYTDKGDLRFPVEDTMKNRVQAGLFGQYANENARYYFDNDIAPLNQKQIKEYKDVDMPIKDYWEYREGLKGLKGMNEKGNYIGNLDLPVDKKNILINNMANRKEPIDYTGYENYKNFEELDFYNKNPKKYEFLKDNDISYEEYSSNKETKKTFDWAYRNPKKYKFLKSINVSYEDYNKDEETKEIYDWAFNNPDKYTLSKAVSNDVVTYKTYTKELSSIRADKTRYGKSISGSRKQKVANYINGLDADYGEKLILFKSEYKADDSYNYEIVDYLNNREDITYDEMNTILKELGFTVTSDGTIYWD